MRLMMCEDRANSAGSASTATPCVVGPTSATFALHDLEECRKVVQKLANLTRPLSEEEIECLVSLVLSLRT